jgi:uncharacterized protein
MRLTQRQQQLIHDTAEQMFGSEVRVLLFGSRVDDSQKGGDIDLLLEVNQPLENRPAAAARFAGKLERALGQRRIDVLIIDPNTALQPIHNTARKTGVAL